MNNYIEKIIELAKDNKYTKYYCNIIVKALLRPQDRKLLKQTIGYVERHHILPKCFGLGGEEDLENLVFLTAKEHFIVHLCAIKMFDGIFSNKMIFAFRRLCTSNKGQDRYINARLYEQIKPNFKEYTRLYKENKVKYLSKSDIESIERLKKEGWGLAMTNEFKEKSRKCMLGKKHSEETKRKMSESAKKIPKDHLRGVKRDPKIFEKIKITRELYKITHPEEYAQFLKERSERTKQMHKDGIFGENPMKGKNHTEEAKEKIRDGQNKYWDKIKENPELLKEKTKYVRKAQKEYWEKEGSRERASITNSNAYKKCKMQPLEYYNKNLKPLLYLGLLPRVIEKHQLINIFTRSSIPRLIEKFGNESDKKQFNKNKKLVAGANRAYIAFMEHQCYLIKNNIISLDTVLNYDLINEYKNFLIINTKYNKKQYLDKIETI
jgi:hypothetical protein